MVMRMHSKKLVAAASCALLLSLGAVTPRAAEAAPPTYPGCTTVLTVPPLGLVVGDAVASDQVAVCTFTPVTGGNDLIILYRVIGTDPGVTVGTQGIVPSSAGFNLNLSTLILNVCVGTDPINPATWTCINIPA